MPSEPWRCYAHPAGLAGRPCGHENTRGGIEVAGVAGGPQKLVCCERCGCTKIASDDRKARLEKAGKA